MQLLYVPFTGSDGEGASVILDGHTLYHEDDDKGYHNENFEAIEVAERLAKALNTPMRTIELNKEDLPEEWNFDDVERVALEKAAAEEGKPATV